MHALESPKTCSKCDRGPRSFDRASRSFLSAPAFQTSLTPVPGHDPKNGVLPTHASVPQTRNGSSFQTCRRRDTAPRSFPPAPAPQSSDFKYTCRPALSGHDPDNSLSTTPAPIPQMSLSFIPRSLCQEHLTFRQKSFAFVAALGVFPDTNRYALRDTHLFLSAELRIFRWLLSGFPATNLTAPRIAFLLLQKFLHFDSCCEVLLLWIDYAVLCHSSHIFCGKKYQRGERKRMQETEGTKQY